MSISSQKLVEHIFFFSILGIAAFLVWLLFAPFLGAISLAAIVVTVCYPIHVRIQKRFVKNETLAAFVSLAFVGIVVVVPLVILSSLVFKEALSIYTIINSSDQTTLVDSLAKIETTIQKILPSFNFDVTSVIEQTANFVVSHFVGLFTATASTIFLFFIALIASFYFFRDGKFFTTYLIQLSPLRDSYDETILKRLAVAVRSVAIGTVFVAMVQGILTAIGLSVVGFDRAILWGCIASVGALIPGVGTSLVFIPSVIYLIAIGSNLPALLIGLWWLLAVGLIDNLLGPYVMSKGNKVHPFLLLLSVLGGIASFGPIGFILGPVILTFFLVLVEIYHSHVKQSDS